MKCPSKSVRVIQHAQGRDRGTSSYKCYAVIFNVTGYTYTFSNHTVLYLQINPSYVLFQNQ